MHLHPRTALRVSVVPLAVALVTVLAGTAVAETPSSWQPGEDRSALWYVLVLGGIPLALFAVLAIIGALTHTSKAAVYPIRRDVSRPELPTSDDATDRRSVGEKVDDAKAVSSH